MIEALRNRIPPALAILLLGIAAGAGFVPLLSLGEDTPPTSEPAATTETTTPQTQLTLVVEVTMPPVEIEGVDPAITRILTSGGMVERLDRATLEAELDPAVVRVLIHADSVLTVLEPVAEP